MKKIGLALSGGGFRGALYHLGVIRFLHDAGILSDVSNITAVSGGSIVAAHLALNWNRYTGSSDEFDAAASELLAFVRADVRNRIVRRYLLAFPLRGVRSLAGLSNRRLTRTGLLEYHYEKYLYGDTSLFQLPKTPFLHLLSTNLSEGRLASFNREGLWTIRREHDQSILIDKTPLGLATVPMAVAASSAFPGFFPPYLLTGASVGATGGEFNRQAYTDGGVFDNLGVRMFDFLAHSLDQTTWDGILVSDAGRPFEIQSRPGAGGLIRTAMRASDILMDRVWQLETETFRDTAGIAFARITEMVDPQDDPIALHPEVQRQLPNVRTDLDRFSQVEIYSLMRHGYCVGRKTCLAHPDLFVTTAPRLPARDTSCHAQADLPSGFDGPSGALRSLEQGPPPAQAQPAASLPRIARALQGWLRQIAAAMALKTSAAALSMRGATAATLTARTLHRSATRRIWSTLLDPRDWATYIYVPIIVPILILTPYFVVKFYERSQRISEIVESLVQENRDLEQMTRLLDETPAPFAGEKAAALPPGHMESEAAFAILQDLRVMDLRRWGSEEPGIDRTVYTYRRLKVRKEASSSSNTFYVSLVALSPDTQVRFPPQQLTPRLYSMPWNDKRAKGLRHFEVGVDFAKVPQGESVDVVYEHLSRGRFLGVGVGAASLAFPIEANTIEQSWWVLMPQGREYRTFQLIRYPTGKPTSPEIVKPVTEFRSNDFKILAFKLLGLKEGYTYELTWFYR
jgi:predicted acylesterase/phospholipase RssA